MGTLMLWRRGWSVHELAHEPMGIVYLAEMPERAVSLLLTASERKDQALVTFVVGAITQPFNDFSLSSNAHLFCNSPCQVRAPNARKMPYTSADTTTVKTRPIISQMITSSGSIAHSLTVRVFPAGAILATIAAAVAYWLRRSRLGEQGPHHENRSGR